MRAAVLVTLSLFLLLGLSIIVVTLADEPEAGEWTVPRISAITLNSRQFYFDYVRRGLPVILEGIFPAAGWRPPKEWTNAFLRSRVGHRYVDVEVNNDGYFYNNFERVKFANMTMNELLDVMFDKADPLDKRHFYVIQNQIFGPSTVLPELRKDVPTPRFCEMLDLQTINFWIGRGGQVTLMHIDSDENIMFLIDGEKEFVIFPFSDTENLYPTRSDNSSSFTIKFNISKPDFEKYPNFIRARPYKITLKAGEGLYLPAFWWHQVYSHGRNVAVNFWFDTHSTPFGNLAYIHLNNIMRRQTVVPTSLKPPEGHWPKEFDRQQAQSGAEAEEKKEL